MKKCCKCKIFKECSEFTKNKSTKDGLYDYCKLCLVLYRQERRDFIRRDKKKYRDNNVEKCNFYQNHSRANNRSRATYENAKYTYGLEKEEFDALISKNKYDICGTHNPGSKTFNMDHCHKTGKVRGLLCSPCNWGLGTFKDNAEIMVKAIEYLKKT